MTGRGGWPMTVFLTPDGRPFFGGTYFPPRDAHGMPSFRRVLDAVDDVWRNRRDEVDQQADALAEAIDRRTRLPRDLVAGARGAEPRRRCPGPGLLATAAVASSGRASTPPGAASGPLRSSPSPSWWSCACATIAPRATGLVARHGHHHAGGDGRRRDLRPSRRRLRPLLHRRHLDGAALREDALRPGRAGARLPPRLAGHRRAALASRWSRRPSATCSRTGGARGRAVLRRRTPTPRAKRVASTCGRPPRWRRSWAPSWPRSPPTGTGSPPGATSRAATSCVAPWARPWRGRRRWKKPGDCCSRRAPRGSAPVSTTRSSPSGTPCSARRSPRRPPPRGARTGPRPPLGIAEFLLAELRRAETERWLRSWQDGRARHLAYAGDYAWVVELFTRLAELTGRAVWLDHAHETARAMLELFGGEGGLLYTTGNDAERLVVRPMDILDGAMPAANGVAAAALLRLGALRGDDELTEAGESLAGGTCPASPLEHPLACANTVAGLRAGGRGHHRSRGHRGAARPARRRRGPGSSRPWSWPGASARRHRCGPAGTTGSATCAGTTSARRPPPARPSSGSASTHERDAGRARAVTPGAVTAHADLGASEDRHRDGQARRERRRGPARSAPRTLGTRRCMVLACTDEDTTAVDLDSGALVRLRIGLDSETRARPRALRRRRRRVGR